MPDQQNDSKPVGAAPAASPPRRSYLAAAAIFLSLVALFGSGWQWFDSTRRFDRFEFELAKRLGDIDNLSRDARSLAMQSRDAMGEASARLGQLEVRTIELQNQRFAIESLYRDLAGSRDEWTLAEVEQVLLIANQQLLLAGNVKAALIAMETADARLARMERAQLTALRRAINADMERLKAVPHLDIVGMTLMLDQIMNQIDAVTLAMNQRPPRPDSEPRPSATGFWQRIWGEVVQDLRDLIRVENIGTPEVPLLSPDQAFFLREHLKLRLLGARLALLAHDEASFRADINAASGWLARYYHGSDKTVAAAQATLKKLVQTDISIQVPDISASLDAVRRLRLVRERVPR